MSQSVAVHVTAFGQGKYDVDVPPASAVVGAVLARAGVDASERRVAVNGSSASMDASVIEGDEITIMPRVEGG